MFKVKVKLKVQLKITILFLLHQLIVIQGQEMSEKLCLKWNDFQDNTNTAFGSLRNDIEFTDVTLACKDGDKFRPTKSS